MLSVHCMMGSQSLFQICEIIDHRHMQRLQCVTRSQPQVKSYIAAAEVNTTWRAIAGTALTWRSMMRMCAMGPYSFAISVNRRCLSGL